MKKVIKSYRLASLTFKLHRNIIQTAEKSYYDVLGVSKTARPK